VSLAGKLVFGLTASERGDTQVSVRSSRPLHAARLLEGKSIAQALATLPLLFSICGKAQSVAAIRAVESALGVAAGPAVAQRRKLLLDLETLREHLWRVVLDWPRFYEQAEDTARASQIVRLTNEVVQRAGEHHACLTRPGLDSLPPAGKPERQGIKQLRALMEAELYGIDLEAWLQFDFDTLQYWLTKADTPLTRMSNWVLQEQWQSLGATASEPLPRLDGDRLLQRLDAEGSDNFIARPDWDGNSGFETGAFARVADHPLIDQLGNRFGPGLLARLAARLVETARICVQLDSANPDPPDTTTLYNGGLGVAEAARGRLYHRVVVRDGTISRYRLLAPTEWNFHPRGPAAQALGSIKIDDPAVARQQADLLIHAIDPCVAYEIHIGDTPADRTEPPEGITEVMTDA
jgi:hypothetical protein